MIESTDLNKALQALSVSYQKELPAKLAEIESLLALLRSSEKIETEVAGKLHRLVHGLTGSGATFGLVALSDAARVLEMTLNESMRENSSRLSDTTLKKIDAQWNSVKSAAARPAAKISHRDTSSEIASPRIGADVSPEHKNGYLLLVEDDAVQAKNLQLQLGYFGYSVKVLHDTSMLKEAIAEKMPAVLIMDVVFSGDSLAGPQIIADLPDDIRASVPVIFVSSRGDIASRLSAVRAGASAYFTKPVDMGQLIDKLDKLTVETSPQAAKILIVDDSPSLASFYSMTLQSAGMETIVVNDPLKVLDALGKFTPELILVDMYMPGCNGLELAKIIRQQEFYVSTPIVFLSAELDVEKHLEAMQFGADDFLTKPIEPSHLISSVASRVQRYRILRSFMVRDSLTGLLNHTKSKEELQSEILRAQRQKNSLVFAMLDIDFFKKVNDNYGHSAGDRVIKSLSRLLQQRLRKTDVIGRYGGEEFAVILTDTNAENAFVILDNIRQAFEKIVQYAENGEFSVTFSCGLAEYPQFSTASEISNAADKALYEAKHAGRNRVITARRQD